MRCPKCGELMHEVYFGDNMTRWRCMACERIYVLWEYEYANGELTRVSVWHKARDDIPEKVKT